MKTVFLAGCAILCLACGCARHYVMTFTNGTSITTASKPKLENGVYKFKDASGQVRSVYSGRVREIAPASMAKEEKARFNPSTGR